MSELGESIIRGLIQAIAFQEDKTKGTPVHHFPRTPEEVDVKAIGKKLDMTQEELISALEEANEKGIVELLPSKENIGIASYDEIKARSIAIAKGEYVPHPDEPKVWVVPEYLDKKK